MKKTDEESKEEMNLGLFFLRSQIYFFFFLSVFVTEDRVFRLHAFHIACNHIRQIERPIRFSIALVVSRATILIFVFRSFTWSFDVGHKSFFFFFFYFILFFFDSICKTMQKELKRKRCRRIGRKSNDAMKVLSIVFNLLLAICSLFIVY